MGSMFWVVGTMLRVAGKRSKDTQKKQHKQDTHSHMFLAVYARLKSAGLSLG